MIRDNQILKAAVEGREHLRSLRCDRDHVTMAQPAYPFDVQCGFDIESHPHCQNIVRAGVEAGYIAMVDGAVSDAMAQLMLECVTESGALEMIARGGIHCGGPYAILNRAERPPTRFENRLIHRQLVMIRFTKHIRAREIRPEAIDRGVDMHEDQIAHPKHTPCS